VLAGRRSGVVYSPNFVVMTTLPHHVEVDAISIKNHAPLLGITSSSRISSPNALTH
jgi:hypothetical protein